MLAPYAIAVIVGEIRTGYVVDEDDKPSLSWSYKATLELVDRLNHKSDGHARFAIEGIVEAV